MPYPTPGPIRESADQLRRMIAASQTWRDITASSVYPSDAAEGVFLRDLPPDQARPVAVVQPFEASAFRVIAGGSQHMLRQEGALLLYMAIDIPAELALSSIEQEFYALDTFGQIVCEIAGQSGLDDLLSIVEMTLLQYGPPDETDIPSLGLYYASVWSVRWGDQ